ncbi:MAG: Crp/Fnr family transcriptional regulator [Sphingobacteriia bacterium]|nr:Crp/Fnr family transcriptional regulator [Sphingobacteriia bacterium]NCC39953.1 Crp/Fnr family transcriptional regulator [Gammaproteobacteria bacterium]
MESALRRSPLFQALDATQLARVMERATQVRLAEGQMLFRQGDPVGRFYLVRTGRMRLFRLAADGAEKVIELIGPGETFAEALMFMGTGRYPVCAAALSPSDLIGIDADDFAAMLRDAPQTSFALLGMLSRRLHERIAEIDNLTLHSAAVRVARWLLRQLPEGASELTLTVRKVVIASRLSITAETWSRIMRRLMDEGVLVVDEHRIRVLDQERLRRLADDE